VNEYENKNNHLHHRDIPDRYSVCPPKGTLYADLYIHCPNAPTSGLHYAMTCALYCRLSREDFSTTGESESIRNQKSLLLQYAESHNWKVYDIYCDEDFSGADRQRPAFLRMLHDAEARKFDIILCKTQSRFTRDMELVEKYIHGKFPLWGIRFVTVVDNVDTDIRGNKKIRQIGGLVNEWYLEDLSENIRTVLDSKRRNGVFIGSFAAYGYRKDPGDKGHLLIDGIAAAVVRDIFQLYCSGNSLRLIADILNHRGIPNPTAYKQQCGLNYVNQSSDRSAHWNKNTVRRILENRLYVGDMVQGRRKKISYKSKICLDVPKSQQICIPNTHAAIVSSDVFDAVQARLHSRSHSRTPGPPCPLSGKVFCGTCGATMVKNSNSYARNPLYYMRCPNGCPSCSIRLDWLQESVAEKLRQHLCMAIQALDKDVVEAHLENTDTITDIQVELEHLHNRREKLQTALRSLYLDKADGLISAEQFQEMSAGFTRESAQLQTRIESVQAQAAGQQADRSAAAAAAIDSLCQLKTLDTVAVEIFISRITVSPRNQLSNTQKIQIVWNF
jgi:site-specific DNA recombinase